MTREVVHRGEVAVFGGEAVVELPGDFELTTLPAFRQAFVTPIGEPCLVAASRIESCRFRIRCSGPDGTRVAWEVRALLRVSAAEGA